MIIEPLKCSEIREFLKDYEENAEIQILEVGSPEETDLIARAKAKGINLDKNTDLAGLKCIYAFTDKPNHNGAILPEKPFLQALPTMIGKPIDIAHNRKMVIGHIIDYSYQNKQKRAIMYGVIYKSNFEDEWAQAQKDLKAKKLNVSFEIWSPKNKRKFLANGDYELYEQEIAGCALLFKEVQPAFDGAKVLAMAKKMEIESPDLVYAKNYCSSDIIVSSGEVTCVDCGRCKPESASETQTVQPITVNPMFNIKCSNCQSAFDAIPANEIKCPKCFAIVSKEGNMIYPPQKKDFKVMCPSCKSQHWLTVSRTENDAKLKCLNELCGKQYEITFAKDKPKDNNPLLSYLYMSYVSCLQCGKNIEVIGTSETTTKNVICHKCGLNFSYDIKGDEIFKKVGSIKVITENSEKGGNVMDNKTEVTASEEKLVTAEVATSEATTPVIVPVVEEKKEVVETATVEPTEVKVEAPKAEETVVVEPKEDTDLEESAKWTKAYIDTLPDSSFAVIEPGYPKETQDKNARHLPFKDVSGKVDLPHLRNALARLNQIKPITTTVTAKELQKTAAAKLERFKKMLKTGKYEKSATLRKAINKYKSMHKAFVDEQGKVEFYKSNAQEILKRRTELGNYKISDEDILNNDKFEKAKLELENAKLELGNQKTNDIVGIKSKEVDYYIAKREEINKRAFPKKN